MRKKLLLGSLLGTMATLLSVVPSAQAQTAPTNAQLLDKILAKVKPGDKVVKTDDMLLSVASLRAYRGKMGGSRHTSSAFYQTQLWAGGNVFYVFDDSLLEGQRKAFLDAAREWESIARLKFAPRTTQANYIRVYKDANGGSFSNIGQVGGMQQMSLADWADKNTAAHEIAHALGVMHEQSRSNRDTYVSIDFTNIEQDKQFNFAIIADSQNIGAYDFDSIMHYGDTAFALDPSRRTIIAKPAYVDFQGKMGQRTHISVDDKKGMVAMYGPPLSTLPPLNDNFGRAQGITGESGSVTGTNKLATVETGEAEATKRKNTATVWYRWRPSKSGSVTIDTKGSAIDTTLGVYQGTSVTTMTQVAFNDDAVMGAATPAAGLTSSVTFNAQLGVNYYIAVDSFSNFQTSGPTGAIKLNWLQRTSAGVFKLRGSVKTTGSSAQALPDVTISLSGADANNSAATATTRTNASGEYAISNLSAGSYNIRASKAGFVFSPASLRVTMSADATGRNFTATPISEANLPEMYVSDVSIREGKSGDSFVTFNVSLSAPSQASASVNYTTINGSAISGSDYNATQGTLTFPAGTTTMTVSVKLRPDTTIESDETFSLRISAASGARIVDETGSATIINDDKAANEAPQDSPQRSKSALPSARTS